MSLYAEYRGQAFQGMNCVRPNNTGIVGSSLTWGIDARMHL
jgi:hypothetical protein